MEQTQLQAWSALLTNPQKIGTPVWERGIQAFQGIKAPAEQKMALAETIVHSTCENLQPEARKAPIFDDIILPSLRTLLTHASPQKKPYLLEEICRSADLSSVDKDALKYTVEEFLDDRHDDQKTLIDAFKLDDERKAPPRSGDRVGKASKPLLFKPIGTGISSGLESVHWKNDSAAFQKDLNTKDGFSQRLAQGIKLSMAGEHHASLAEIQSITNAFNASPELRANNSSLEMVSRFYEGDSLQQLGHMKQSDDSFKRALEIFDTLSEDQQSLHAVGGIHANGCCGLLAWSKGDYQIAEKHFQNGIRLHERFPNLHQNATQDKGCFQRFHALSAWAQSKPDIAIHSLQSYLRSPAAPEKGSDAWIRDQNLLGSFFQKTGNHEKALACYQEILSQPQNLNPTRSLVLHYHSGVLWQKIGDQESDDRGLDDYEKSQQSFEQSRALAQTHPEVFRLHPEWELLLDYKHGEVSFKLNDAEKTDDSLTHFFKKSQQNANRLNPNDPELQELSKAPYWHGLAQMACDKPQEAMQSLQTFLSSKGCAQWPEQELVAQSRVASLLKQSGDHIQADKSYKKLFEFFQKKNHIEFSEDNKTLEADSRYAHAYVLQNLGKEQEAIESLHQALQSPILQQRDKQRWQQENHHLGSWMRVYEGDHYGPFYHQAFQFFKKAQPEGTLSHEALKDVKDDNQSIALGETAAGLSLLQWSKDQRNDAITYLKSVAKLKPEEEMKQVRPYVYLSLAHALKEKETPTATEQKHAQQCFDQVHKYVENHPEYMKERPAFKASFEKAKTLFPAPSQGQQR